MAGIDIGVHRSDRRARAGKLNRQGSPQLRWALYEAALSACRPSSPDHADYLALKRPRPQPHARLADDREQARAPLLPRAPRARARRAGTCRGRVRPQPVRLLLRYAQPSTMTSTLPAGSRKCPGSRPTAAAHQRPSGRSHSTRTDRSTITSPTTRSRTQIRPGIHGADQHNHSPPQPLTQAPVQIRRSTMLGRIRPRLTYANVASSIALSSRSAPAAPTPPTRSAARTSSTSRSCRRTSRTARSRRPTLAARRSATASWEPTRSARARSSTRA